MTERSYTTLSVDKSTLEKMKERKPRGVTWDFYFRAKVLDEGDEL